jgi:hypothetical protein
MIGGLFVGMALTEMSDDKRDDSSCYPEVILES